MTAVLRSNGPESAVTDCRYNAPPTDILISQWRSQTTATVPPRTFHRNLTPPANTMGSIKKRRKTKINKHKRKKRMKQNRHKKRLRYKS